MYYLFLYLMTFFSYLLVLFIDLIYSSVYLEY